jgi:hypothetical protein
MRKFWSGVLAATFVASVSVAAAQEQAPRPSSPGGGGAVGTAGDRDQAPSPARGAQGGASKSITVSGCIQNAPAAKADAGGAGAGASASSAAKFILAMKPAGGAAGGGAVGTAGTGGTRYQLDGEEKAISPHLNHQVEVTGTLDPAAGAGAGAPTLKVESVKMVAATCS